VVAVGWRCVVVDFGVLTPLTPGLAREGVISLGVLTPGLVRQGVISPGVK